MRWRATWPAPAWSCAAAATWRRRSARPPATPIRSEVVLLAPACASFDAYRDYEERGEHFRSLVEELER